MRERGDFSFGAAGGRSTEILRALSAAVGPFFFSQGTRVGLIKDGRIGAGEVRAEKIGRVLTWTR